MDAIDLGSISNFPIFWSFRARDVRVVVIFTYDLGQLTYTYQPHGHWEQGVLVWINRQPSGIGRPILEYCHGAHIDLIIWADWWFE